MIFGSGIKLTNESSMYLPMQENIYRRFFETWMNDPAPAKPYMRAMRDLNMETSLVVFLGPYLTVAQRQELNDKYWLITLALQLVNFPFAIPGTKIYNAVKARKLVMKYLMAACAASKIRMQEPHAESECLLDEWIKAMMDSRRGANEDGEQAKLLSREYSDREIGMVILSFLFASQDAMSSAIVYAFQLTADHPEVLAKIREEQYRVRGNDLNAPLTLDLLDDMVYTQAAVKEAMRLRPSVIMVSTISSSEHVRRSCSIRCRTSPRGNSPLPKTTLCRRVQCSFQSFGTRCMTRHATPSQTPTNPRDGSKMKMGQIPWQKANLKTSLSSAADRTR